MSKAQYRRLAHDGVESQLPASIGGNGPLLLRTRLLGLSMALNVTLIIAIAVYFSNVAWQHGVTEYAKLSYNTPVAWDYTSNYGSYGIRNFSEQDRLWESIQVGAGNIVFTLNEAKDFDLPHSQPFPWDRDRRMYLTAGYHNLHCLKKIRRHVMQINRGQQPFDGLLHVMHCLDAIRQDIICHADDTPMYMWREAGPKAPSITAQGQTRMCRDWSQLEKYVAKHNACFSYVNETEGVTNEIERYKFCPKDSIFAENMHNYFELPDDTFIEPWETVPDYSQGASKVFEV